MKTETMTSAGNCPVDGTVRPVAWCIEYAGNEKELYFERRPYGISQSPLYDQAALDAAVEQANARQNSAWRLMCAKMIEAERAKWQLLTNDSAHIFNGGCPEQGNWNCRDPECRACVLLGEWQA
jgi:hypothetical protein